MVTSPARVAFLLDANEKATSPAASGQSVVPSVGATLKSKEPQDVISSGLILQFLEPVALYLSNEIPEVDFI